MCDLVRKTNALMSFYFNIPHPEDLDDEIWMEKLRQIQWLAESKILGTKLSDG
ncbi:MAG: hypothetical protein N4A49_01785 [Marinifilaceae bacterium]|jgi:hypothetical protein|nr:hypothetical protein [Marinifilaceae bacterium]